MFLSIGVILFVLFIAYLWTSQGMFSAFLHLICTVAAGGVAFAAWEPLSYLLMGVRQDIAWTVGLAGPFLVSLAIFRIACDKMITGNLEVSHGVDMAGGGVFGFGSGLITAGIVVISIGFLRLPPDMFGYKPVRYDDATGSVVRGSSLWLPVDSLTVSMYEHLSLGSFSAGRSALALRNPDVHLQAGLVRMTIDGKARTTMLPGDVRIIGTYEVTGNRQDLLKDSFSFDEQTGDPIVQNVLDFDGQPLTGNVKIWGVAIEFLPGAREDTGQIVIGPGQMRLNTRMGDGELFSANPYAVISQREGASLELGRWRFDAPEVFVASVGGGTSTKMTFEFLVPGDAEPIDLMIKNVRITPQRLTPLTTLSSPSLTAESRDQAVRSRALLGETGGPVASAPSSTPSASTSSSSAPASTNIIDGTNLNSLRQQGVFVGVQLATGPIPKSSAGGLRLNEQNQIIGGTTTIARADIADRRSSDPNLIVDKFSVTPDTVIVQVDVSLKYRSSPFGRALSAAEMVMPVLLHDTIGQTYQPIGFLHEDGRDLTISFDPGAPIQALSQVPRLSRSKPDDELTLVFRVSRGVEIRQLTLGSTTVLADYNPPIQTERR